MEKVTFDACAAKSALRNFPVPQIGELITGVKKLHFFTTFFFIIFIIITTTFLYEIILIVSVVCTSTSSYV